jgi:hypothetical protein
MSGSGSDEAGGFFLALFLLDNMGVVYDRRELLRRLDALASGDVSAFGTPEQEIALAEQRRGAPLTDDERAALVAGLKAREEVDRYVQEVARRVRQTGQRFGFHDALR